MKRMELAGGIWSAIKHARGLRGERIHELSDAERELLGWLRDEGFWE